ncbi:MAG: nucleotidyltransferase domain-containing protein [Clostridia bacterium]|nr:nucleotidyltransferase domain-containing protein [Clostridia bacterium]
MCSQQEAQSIVEQLSQRISQLYPQETPDVILFGSYARRDADEGSDIDVLYLVDAPRQEIAARNWQVGAAAAELLLEHGVVVSPVVENRAFFRQHAATLPFFRNIQQEGVRLGG